MEKLYCTMHKMHCSSACLLKLYCKDGIIEKITSAGDIPLENCEQQDEALFPPQRRACPRGYAEIDHIYSPFRLTKPLLQTGPRGSKGGFRPISWKEAVSRAADFYHAMMRKADSLGYLPVLEKHGVGAYLGRSLATFGNSSSGCVDGAIRAAIGDKAIVKGHPPIGLFLTNYLILWANNPAETLPYLSFWLIRAREKGIPITVVDSRYTDSAAAYGTGYGKVPPLICIRPGTDGALLAAMAYVIWKRNLWDEPYVRRYCFGFFPEETIVSRSRAWDPVDGTPYAGRCYRVPKGESFQEYLEDLEDQNGGYEGVLSWACQITGVEPQVIEDFAVAYATAKPAFLFSRYNGGAQRSVNGLYYSWMMIALSAMTGNLTRPGGGFGELCGDDESHIRYPDPPQWFQEKKHTPILISQFTTDRMILTGLDGRSPAQLRDDVLRMNGIDLGEDARIRIEGIVKGVGNGNPFNQIPHINLRRISWNRLSFVMTYEREFSPMARMSDLVLPSAGQYEGEDTLVQHRFGGSDTYLLRRTSNPPGEAKTDRQIQTLLGQALGLHPTPEDEFDALARRQWARAELHPQIAAAHPQYELPAYETLEKEGIVHMPEDPGDIMPSVCSFAPGEFPTETGRINFYSPFVAQRNRAWLGVHGARYVPHPQGVVMSDNSASKGAKGMHYSLLLINPHSITKADATYANVPALKALRRHCATLHPAEAQKRGLTDGQKVWVFNDYGCLSIPLHISASVPEGVVCIPHGAWYQEDESDRYEAWFDSDGDDVPEPHDTAVDAGGNTNTITPDAICGLIDPFIVGMGLGANGHVCEVSGSNPDSARCVR